MLCPGSGLWSLLKITLWLTCVCPRYSCTLSGWASISLAESHIGSCRNGCPWYIVTSSLWMSWCRHAEWKSTAVFPRPGGGGPGPALHKMAAGCPREKAEVTWCLEPGSYSSWPGGLAGADGQEIIQECPKWLFDQNVLSEILCRKIFEYQYYVISQDLTHRSGAIIFENCVLKYQ